jgi:peptidoglycan/xylan/chitin deacetylase (PgdA/CDA1 family)
MVGSWLPLGNHTYDHVDFDRVSAQAYIANIARIDHLLQTITPGQPLLRRRHIFRYPYLAEGETLQKRDAFRIYLFRNGYRIAEVTVNYNDWAWNKAYVRCVRQNNRESIAWLKTHIVEDAQWNLNASTMMAGSLFHRNIPQILLIHIGVIDAVTLDTILKNFRAHHVKFITLDEALADPIHNINPNYAYRGEETFLEQVATSRHVDVAKYVDGIYPMDRQNTVCIQKQTAH